MASFSQKQYSSHSRYGRSAAKNDSIERAPSPPTGVLLKSITRHNLVDNVKKRLDQAQKVGIVDSGYLTSFSWTDNDEPTILIPGRPPLWTPVEKPYKLEEDNGEYYRDPNAARYSCHPMEAAVRALHEENNDFKTQEVDLFACSSTLGNLIRFTRRIAKPFRFTVQKLGNTVFFIRRENSPTELIEGVRGYGHTFPETYTTWTADVKGSVSYQRLLKYNMAGIDCIVRYECDGYFKDKDTYVDTTIPYNQSACSSEEDLGVTLNDMKVGQSISQTSNSGGDLQIKHAGSGVSQEAVFELKTRSIRKKQNRNTLEEELARLWITQASHFILAYHDSGVFNEINITNVKEDIVNWERDNQMVVKCLQSLLTMIIGLTSDHAGGKLEIVCRNTNFLEIREQDTAEHEVLSSELKQWWMQGGLQEEDDLAGKQLYKGDYLSSSSSDGESVPDFTACSAEECGYCGHCSY